jgi:hypothetical protein
MIRCGGMERLWHTRTGRPMHRTWAILGASIAMLWGDARVQAAERYDGHALARVQIETPGDAQAMQALGLDVWDDRPGPPELLARVAPEQWAMLDVTGFDYEIVLDDLGPRIEAEALRLAHRPPAEEAFYADFRTLDEIDARLVALSGDRPDLVELFDIGPSLEGRPILGVRIGAGEDKSAVLVTSGTHAREWVSMMAGIHVAESFVTRAEETAIAELLEQVELIVVPVVNPDGYTWSWEEDRLWRKNRRDGFGVDLNRNFGIAWGGEGSSGNPQAGNYRGEAPFSEPESVAVRELVEATSQLVGHVDIHSYGQLVLYPWGYTEDPAPADASLTMLATELADALETPHDQPHTPLQGALFYPAAGNIPDWMYGEHGVHSFTFELRPDEADPFFTGFLLPPDQILAACEETLSAIEQLARWSAGQAPGMPGDDGAASTDTGSTTEGDDTVDGTESSTSDAGSNDDAATQASTTDAVTGTTGSPASADESSADGCGCRTQAPHGRSTWMLAWLVFAGARRRRAGARAVCVACAKWTAGVVEARRGASNETHREATDTPPAETC